MRLALDRWRALERDGGEALITVTGGLDIGPAGGRVVTGSKEACGRHCLRHEVLAASAAMRRFPAWRLPVGFEAVYQPEAGFLRADRGIAAHVALARRLGGEVHENEPVRACKASAGGVAVTTERGRYHAGSVVVAAGAWTSKLLDGFGHLAIPERQVVAWFPTFAAPFAAAAFPVFILECPQSGLFYGFPSLPEEGLKIGKFHHRGERVDPDLIDRRVVAADLRVLHDATRYLTTDLGAPLAHKTCMFVNSPDEHFIIDVLPEAPTVVVAAGFSGHGYKFCAAIGEILADLASDGATARDIAPFRLARPALRHPR